MGNQADQAETTLVFEYPAKTVELYTTDRRLWLRAIRRNPRFIEATDLKPGYRLLYPIDQVRSAELILSGAPGGDDVQQQFMTAEELEHRANLSTRAKGIFGRED